MNRNPSRVPNTCNWFLEHEKYQSWRQKEIQSLLWVSADPGCGKSVLSKFLVDELNGLESQATLPGCVCHFFFKEDSEDQKSAIFALRGLLHQLFTKRNPLLQYAMGEFHTKGQKFAEEFSTLWKILLAATTDPSSGNVICIVDGLDECEESTRRLFIDSLIALYSAQEGSVTKSSIRFLITSRPKVMIERPFRQSPTIRLKAEEEIKAINLDICRVVDARIVQLQLIHGFSTSRGVRLRDVLVARADQTFLWVSLILEILAKAAEDSEYQFGKIVDTLPTNLEAVYEQLLQGSHDPVKARKLLQIVTAACRPLTLEEMNIALAIQPHHRSIKDIELHLVSETSIEMTVKGLSGLFVRVIDERIYLVHQTAREYLIRRDGHEVNPSLEILSGSC